MAGSASMARVISAAKISRSTVSAWPAGNPRARRDLADQQRAQPAQFFFQQPGRAILLFALEGIAADQFGQIAGLVGRRLPQRAHFVKHRSASGARHLPRRLASRPARRR